MLYESEAGLLLSDRYEWVATPDMQAATGAIERLQGPFTGRPRSPARSCEPVRVRAAHCGHVALSTFQFGADIDIEPRGLDGAILVTTAVRGKAGIAVRGGVHAIAPGATFITQPEDRPTFLYEPATEVLKLRFERHRVEELCVRMYERVPDAPLRFDGLLVAPAASRRWAALLRFVVASVNATGAGAGQPCGLEMEGMEEMLMLTLLSIQPHNHDSGSGARVRAVFPRQYRLAVDYIHQHLDTDITLPGIAQAAGCSIRSLARVFQQGADTSPMQYVQKLRLQRIRADLLRPASDEQTIADIAYHWGYRHLGEFNRKYREAYHETPSETRQRQLARFQAPPGDSGN